jgi:hypothetical protein
LQKAVIGALLNLDEVRDLDGCGNLGKVETLAVYVVLCHAQELLLSGSRGCGTSGMVMTDANSGATILLNETAAERYARKKATGTRRDEFVLGRH